MIRKAAAVLIILCLSSASLFAQNKKTVRIGYFEPGQYFMTKVLMGEVHTLIDRIQGDSLEILFEPYAFKSAEWRRNLCRAMAGDLARIDRIDLVIAAGPWVVEDLLDAGFKKPIIAIYQFDPVAAGLLDATLRPLAPNLTMMYDPDRVIRDFSVINRFFPNARVGLVYFPSGDEFTEEVKKITNIASNFGNKLYAGEYYNIDSVYAFFASRKQIIDSVDILYAPPLWGMEIDKISQFFSETHFSRKPVFTYDGFLLVEKGAYFCGTDLPHRIDARLTVDKILKIANGAKPKDLPVIFPDLTTVCINLDEAGKMGHEYSDYELLGAKTIPAQERNPETIYDLASAVRQALVENPDILAIEQTYQKALHEKDRAVASYFPRFNLRAGAAASDNEVEASIYNRVLNREYFADVIADQKIFSYQSIKLIQAAKKNLEIKKADLEQARHDLQLAVTGACFDVLHSTESVVLLRQQLDNLRKLQDDAIVRSRLGTGDSLDISIFGNLISDARIALHRANADVVSSRAVFNILTNRPADFNFILDTAGLAPDIMANMVLRLEEFVRDSGMRSKFRNYLVDLGVGNSFDLKRSEFSINRQKDLIAASRGYLYPEISLRAKYSYSGEFDPEFDKKMHDWSIGGILSFPLFGGLLRKGNTASLKAELDLLAYRKDAARLKVTQDITVISERLFTLMLTLPQNYDLMNKGRLTYDIIYDRYETGKADITSYLRAMDEQRERERRLLDERYRFFAAYAELLHAVGQPFMLYGTEADRNFYARLQIEMTK